MTNGSEADASGSGGAMGALEIADRLLVMRQQEETAYRCSDYLVLACAGDGPSDPGVASAAPQQEQAKPVDEECRVKMAEWCTQVVDFCKFRRETVGIGLNYLDRFLSTAINGPPACDCDEDSSGSSDHEFDSGLKNRALRALRDRKEYQLAAMTSLYMAIKLNEPLEMETSLLSELSRGCYTDAEIAHMELDMLDALDWRVSGPTALSFVSHFLALIPPSVSANPMVPATLLDFCRYQTELATGDYHFVTKRPSTVAMASLLNSMEAIDDAYFDQIERSVFFQTLLEASSVRPDAPEVSDARIRLMTSFRKSSGYELRHVASQLCLGGGRGNADTAKMQQDSEGEGSVDSSPVCVSATKRSRYA